jgi:diguanylate cyclase (GGDEF)-like protein
MSLREKKLRMLLAEGGSGKFAASLRALYPEEQGKLELTVVSGVSNLLATVEVVNPEVILLDLSLAHADPMDAVRFVHRAKPAVPLIVLLNEEDKSLAVESQRQGALDYLFKERLDVVTIERVLRVALEQNTVEGLADLLRDPVTGLYIRESFLTLGVRAMENANRRNCSLVLLCLRIENLASIRTELGSRAAEGSLCRIGALLSGCFRRTDIVARLGESQFAALAIDAVEPSAPVLCQRLQRRMAVLNQDIDLRGALELRMNVKFWSPRNAILFSEWLDSVEAGLRNGPAAVESRPQAAETFTKG